MLYIPARCWKLDVLPISMEFDGVMCHVVAWRMKKDRTTIKEYKIVPQDGSFGEYIIEVNHGMWWRELKDVSNS